MLSSAAYKLVYGAANPSLTTWTCTAKTIQRQDRSSRPSRMGGVIIVNLSNTAGAIYSDSKCTNVITDITINLGASTSATFYYNYSTIGSQTITGSLAGLVSANETTTVSVNPHTWVGGGGCNSIWATGACWSGGSSPAAANTAHFDGVCATNCSPTINANITIDGISVHPSYTGTITNGGITANVTNIAITGGTTTFSGVFSRIINWFYSSGALTLNASTMNFGGGLPYGLPITINPGAIVFGDVGLLATNHNAETIIGTLNVGGNLIINQDNADNLSSCPASGIIAVKGNVTATAGAAGTGCNATLLLNGSSNQTVTSVATGGIPRNIAVNSTGGTVTFSGTVSNIRSWTHTAGTVSMTGATVNFGGALAYGSPISIDAGATVFNDVGFLATNHNAESIVGTLNVGGNLIINQDNADSASSCLASGTIAVAGNVTATAGGMGQFCGATLLLNGSSNQTLTSVAAGGIPRNIAVNSTGGTVTFSGTVSQIMSWTHTAGAVSLAGTTVNFGRAGATYTAPVMIDAGATVFNDVGFYATNSNAETIVGTLNVGGNLTFNQDNALGTSSCPASGTIAVKGNVTATAGGVGPNCNATLLLNGSSNQTVTSVVAGGIPRNIEVNSTGGTVTFSGTISYLKSWTHTAGTASLAGTTINFGGNAMAYGVAITINAGATVFNNVGLLAQNVNTETIVGTINVGGTLTVDQRTDVYTTTINTGTIAVQGDLVFLSGGGGNAAITFNGSGAQAFSYTTGTLPTGTFTVNKSSGTLTLNNNMTLAGASQAFTISQGTLALNGQTLQVGSANSGTMTVTGGSSVLQCGGGCGAGTACGQGTGKLLCNTLSVNSGGTVSP